MKPDITTNQCYANYIWFETYPKPLFNDDEADYGSNFDYEMLFDGSKRIYLDISLKTNAVAIMFRTGFEFENKQLSWSDIFTPNCIDTLTKQAIQKCNKAFNEFCEYHKIHYPPNLDAYPTIVDIISSGIIEQYIEFRSSDDVDNAYLLNNIGLECEMGTDSYTLFNCTFEIVDELLFFSSIFKNAYNREVFSDYVPLPRYITIRNKYTYLAVEDLSLNILDTILFFQCLGCALQMLVGDKSDLLKSAIKHKAIDEETIKLYLKVGTNIFAQLREMLQSSNARLLDIENQPDWNSIIL